MADAPARPKKRNSAKSQAKAASVKDGVARVKQEPVEEEAPAEGPNILSAENFTHGGVRKAKFEPKVPTRRQKKAAAVKSETGEDGETELPGELMKLVKQSQEDATSRSARRADIRAPARVAFGCGTSVAGRAAAGFHKGGGGSGGSGGTGGGKKPSLKSLQGNIEDGMMLDEKEEDLKKSLSQTWDLSKYYPVTLPLQKPGSAEHLDEDQSRDFEENAVPAADELGLMRENDEDRLLFFQLPSFLPLSKTAVGGSAKGSESSSSTKRENSSSTKPDHIGPSTWLEKLPAGHMGKLLVYSSGAVKLRLGDTLFEAVAGSQCVFAQQLVGINATTQHCCFLGDVTERVVLVPCLEDFLHDSSNEPQRFSTRQL